MADCINHEFNKTFGCIIAYIIEIKNLHNYKLCDQRVTSQINTNFENFSIEVAEKVGNINRQCRERYLPDDCRTVYLSQHSIEIESENKSTRVIIIPKNFHQMNYQEKLKTGIDDLFYELGGTIGLWIGWSVQSVSNLPSLISKTSMKIAFYFKIYVYSLKRYISRIKLSLLQLFNIIKYFTFLLLFKFNVLFSIYRASNSKLKNIQN